jgi:hypothetical protein
MTVAGYWMVVDHEQGAWVTPPYSAANFLASGATWTVEAADVVVAAYRLSGRTLQVTCNLALTSLNTASPYLQMFIQGGFTTAKDIQVGGILITDNGIPKLGAARPNGTGIIIYNQASANFSAAANTTYVVGSVAFEVT